MDKGISIAIAGKGGTGKTTISGIIITELINRLSGRVLAVDADPSENLGFILGVTVEETLGNIREDTLENIHNFPAGMTKSQYLEYRINGVVQEYERFDLLTMGRSEGPGCYCYVNRLLRTALDTLSKNYSYIVMDCEAGLEHISRRTSREVDHLIVVSDSSVRGLDVAIRIARMADILENRIGKKHLVLNRWDRDNTGALQAKIDEVVKSGGYLTQTYLQENREIARMDMDRKSVFKLSGDLEICDVLRTLVNKEILQ